MTKRLILFITVTFLLTVSGCGTEKNGGSLAISSDVEFGEDDYSEIVAANNELGLDLLANIERDEEGNVFISPTSLFMALSMLYNGADGVTQKEIATVLHKEGIDADALSRANASLMNKLHSETEKIQLNVGNSIWLNEDYQFEEQFAQTNRDYFNAEIQEINVADSASAQQINDWVAEATNDKIDEIVGSELNPNLVALLINAIYFKGDWQYPFDEENTEDRLFNLKEGNEKELPMMSLQKHLPYLGNESFQAVSLPYGEGEMSMKVFLPKKSSSLEEFEQLLTMDNWRAWNAEFRSRQGTILLPKFQLEYEAVLNDALEQLGMVTAFGGADLSRMVQGDGSLPITEVKQKTFIDVNEEGTEAAAATSVATGTSAPAEGPFHMEVNRPFFIAIADEESGVILFLGSIANPEEGQ